MTPAQISKFAHRSFVAALLFLASGTIRAGSATWNLNPTGSNWSATTNWTPATVPNSPTDVATFGPSNSTSVSLRVTPIEVNSIIFDAGASAYTISSGSVVVLTISGAGIVNNSGVVQNFVTPESDFGGGGFTFNNSATVGDDIVFTIGFNDFSGGIAFNDDSSAGTATYNNSSNIFFEDGAKAASATFINEGTVYFSAPGHQTADAATFINNGGGSTYFYGARNLGNSTVIANGGTAFHAHGGYVEIGLNCDANTSTFIATGGTNGGDGGTILNSSKIASRSSVQVFGNGSFDIRRGFNSTTIGSLEGNGKVFLGDHLLIVGSNNRTTDFSGVLLDAPIQGNGGGALRKIGRGSLNLTGTNTYTGGTFVWAGDLVINNVRGSGTGTGPVSVTAGRIGGQGTIASTLTVGTGSGTGSVLAPGKTPSKIGTLTILDALVLNSDATYTCGLDSATATSDNVVANGVTIASGAQISLSDLGNTSLAAGTVFTVVSNTSAAPISGTFSNLPDNGTIMVGGNTFQANYEGGDGNDLTLTVIP